MARGISESDRRFEIPGIARIVEGNGGLPKVSVSSPEAAGEMYLHGAHVTSWKPAGGEEVLFLSSRARWEDGRAIRGGVPVCFPWFGDKADDPKAPAHGFVRLKTWQLESIARAGSTVTVSMFTESDENTQKWWPAEFRLVHRATFARELSLELEMTNTGRTPLCFEEALHAYHRVGSIEAARVRGLDTVHYLDKTDSDREKVQQGAIVSRFGNRSRVLGHHRCDRAGRSRLTSAHARFEAEFTHHNGVESVGAEGTRFVGSRDKRMARIHLHRNLQCWRFCRGSRPRSAIHHESCRQSQQFLICSRAGAERSSAVSVHSGSTQRGASPCASLDSSGRGGSRTASTKAP